MQKNKSIFLIVVFFVFFFLVLFFVPERTSNDTFVSDSEDVFIYNYYEKDHMYKENYKYFLQHVVSNPDNRDIDFFIVINGTSTVSAPSLPNVSVIHRQNKGYDFGAYSHCVTHHIKRKYKYYIFMNTSMRGPFPTHINWRKEFKSLFHTNVKLVGVSINMLEREQLREWGEQAYMHFQHKKMTTHVQSMFFMLDHEAFDYLQKHKKFFADEEELNMCLDMFEIIVKKEIGLSQYILENGWNINAILPKYRNKNYLTLDHNINPSCFDPYFSNCYWGKDIQPEEAIFHKISRLPS